MARRKAPRPAQAFPECARDAAPRKDSKLRFFFLCDQCTKRWTREAFEARVPSYQGEELEGYCGLCNSVGPVRVRAWFLCEVCNRVAASIGRNHVAEAAIIDFWRREVTPRFPELTLTQTDRSALLPHRRGDASGSAPLDFMVSVNNAPVFLIENKTGRSAADEMRVFQLDVSDCDTISHQVRSRNLPAYIIHAQVLESWDRIPTMGFRSVGLWWTDIFTLAAHFKSAQMRRDESRNAAFFNKKAFSPISTFVDQLRGETLWRIVERFGQEGLPAFYPVPQPDEAPDAEPRLNV